MNKSGLKRMGYGYRDRGYSRNPPKFREHNLSVRKTMVKRTLKR